MKMSLGVVAGIMLVAVSAGAQTNAVPNSQPNPYGPGESWGHKADGKPYGSLGACVVAPNGVVWVVDRCGQPDNNACKDRPENPILAFDTSGKQIKSFGAGLFTNPHGMDVDKGGNVWVTDTAEHIVVKFSPEGKVLLTLGKKDVKGDGEDVFNAPSDVLVAPNGNIFVEDGHGGKTNHRIVKFSPDGKFIMAWGTEGSGPGQLSTDLHSLAMDSQGRLFVADRGNARIQIFDQNGKFMEEWHQFGEPSGLAIVNDILYVTDSKSDGPGGKVNPPYIRGFRVGSAKDGKVTAFVPYDFKAPPISEKAKPNAGEAICADSKGTIWNAETFGIDLKRYVPKKNSTSTK
jgi:sugar lactone lactonase YvrE